MYKDDQEASARHENVLILAPIGRDAELTSDVLKKVGLSSEICKDGFDLAKRLEAGPGLALIAEEALDGKSLRVLAEVLGKQEPWSDCPLIITTLRGQINRRNLTTFRALECFTNATILERPVKKLTLISAVNSAILARRRQYQVRDLLLREQTLSRMKDEFLAVLSHELRTPLSVILGYSEIIRDLEIGSSEFYEALETISRNATTQSQLIDDLLDVSRFIAGKIVLRHELIQLPHVIDAAIDALQFVIKDKGISIRQGFEQSSQFAIVGDAVRLQQVVWNLLSNAIKFSKINGTIDIDLVRKDDENLLSIRDYGDGIDPDFTAFVFDKFRQQDASKTRKFGGLGLGLSIVRHIVEAHNGEASVQSDGCGKGSTFTVKLPALSSLNEAISKETSNESQFEKLQVKPSEAQSGASTILVVDDRQDNRRLLKIILERMGTKVIEADSSRKAYAVIQSDAVDAMICDISMPDESGLEFIRRLRASDSVRDVNLPAASLSAYASAKDKEEALAAGFNRHLTKPVDIGELSKVVSHLLSLN